MRRASSIFGLIVLIGVAIYFFIADDPSAKQHGKNSDNSLVVGGADGSSEKLSLSANAPKTQRVTPSIVSDIGELWIGDKKITGLPRSLRGTQLNGSLRVDANGDLIVEKGNKQFFDYFLNTIGELSPEEVISRLKAGIREFLPPKGAEQALVLLQNYLDYKMAVGKMPFENHSSSNEIMDVEHYQKVMEQRSSVRREYLSDDVADLFWGDEESYDQFTLERTRVERDQTLTVSEKEALITQLEAGLPEKYSSARKKFKKLESINQTITSLEKSHADQEEIVATWREQYGDEAAERYLELQKKRSEWNNRYESYRLQRQELEGALIGAQAQQVAIKELQQSLFNETELKRVQSLDKLQAEEQFYP